METITTTYPGGRGCKATFTDLNLDTVEDTRASYAALIKAYAAGETSENQARALAYLFAGYLQYWRTVKDLDIEQRLDAIEESLKGRTDD